LLTGIADTSVLYEEFLEIARAENSRVIIAGQITDIEVEPGLNLQILYPAQSLAGQKLKETNDSSIVAKLVYDNFAVLLTGDATTKVEQTLIRQQAGLSVDILKVAHHGSNSCSGLDFLKKARPELAVISVGINKFNHPNPEVMARLDQLNIPVWTTFDFGDIVVKSDGQKFWSAKPLKKK
jgi:competence protein ComEC